MPGLGSGFRTTAARDDHPDTGLVGPGGVTGGYTAANLLPSVGGMTTRNLVLQDPGGGTDEIDPVLLQGSVDYIGLKEGTLEDETWRARPDPPRYRRVWDPNSGTFGPTPIPFLPRVFAWSFSGSETREKDRLATPADNSPPTPPPRRRPRRAANSGAQAGFGAMWTGQSGQTHTAATVTVLSATHLMLCSQPFRRGLDFLLRDPRP